MKFDLDNKKTFIPEFNGNKSLPPEEQISVIYKVPTAAQKKSLKPRPDVKFQYTKDGQVSGGEVMIKADQKPIIDTLLIRICGLTVNDEKGPRAVATATDLYKLPVTFMPLIDEIGDFLEEELEKKLPEKNSE